MTENDVIAKIEHDKWLKERMTGIGGSDASVVIGINPWKSRLELWNEKVNGIIIQKDNPDLNWGKILEPVIIKEYEKATKRVIEESKEHLRDKVYPFMVANLDGIIRGSTRPALGVLEVKTKGAYVNWGDYEIPPYYTCQMQHYLAVTDYSWGSFAVLDLGKKELAWFDVERDKDFICFLIRKEKEFWNLVVNKTPPDIENTDACNDYLRKIYPDGVKEKTLYLKDDVNAYVWAKDLHGIKEKLKVLEESEIECKNNLMYIMGDAEKGIGDGFNITWKSPKDKIVFDVESFALDYPDLLKKYSKPVKQTRRFTTRFDKDFC